MIKKVLEKKRWHKSVNNKEVVLIADHIKPRVIKIGCALRNKNFRIVLILKKQSKSEITKTDIKFFDKVCFFEGKEEVYKKCLLFSPLVYHVFMEAYVEEWVEYIIRNKTEIGKVVYDQYDIYRGFVINELDEAGQREKYCLENADGLCCRMFETQHLKHKYHYQFKGKRILFLDYCWNNNNNVPVINGEDDRLKFVYGGRLLARPISNADRYKIELHGFEHLARTIQNHNDYFVMIPSKPCKGTEYSAYRSMRRKYSHLLIKDPMDFSTLINYESRMDYGIDCVELEEDMEKYCEQVNSFNMRAKNRYYATNKYFDYLDAGVMPIYGRKGEMFGNYLSRVGGAIWCSLEEMPDKMEELRKEREINKKKVCEARNALAIDKQIGRLIAFYKDI